MGREELLHCLAGTNLCMYVISVLGHRQEVNTRGVREVVIVLFGSVVQTGYLQLVISNIIGSMVIAVTVTSF